MAESGLNPLEGEQEGGRGMPGVNDRQSTVKRGLIFLILVLMVSITAAAIYWNREKDQQRQAEAAKAKAMRVTSSTPPRTFSEPPAPPLPAPRAPDADKPAAPPPLPIPVVSSKTSAGPAAAAKPPPVLDKSGSSLMVVAETNGSAKSRKETPEESGQNPEGGPLSSMLTSTQTAKRMAKTLGRRDFILAKGSYIDCVLQTRLDSTVPGMTACIVTRHIYSDNGKVVLIDRGSTISGEYQSNLKQGQKRIYVLWSRIKTPNGIIVNLDSPASDPLGGAGLPGWVDTHFGERFGGALLLSVVDGVIEAASQNDDSETIRFTGGDATQDMATETLKNSINIPPTLYKNQGERVGVYVARDLDFSGVYSVAVLQ